MDSVLAIGLNVGSIEPRKQLQKTLDQIQRFVGYWGARLINVRIIESEWQGVPERTLQVRVTELPHDVPAHVIREMAVALKQEAIAAWLTGSDRWTIHYAQGRSAPGLSLGQRTGGSRIKHRDAQGRSAPGLSLIEYPLEV